MLMGELFLWGAVSALIGSATRTGMIELPRVIKGEGPSGHPGWLFVLGFLGAPLLGGLLAALGSTTPMGALVCGLGAAYGGAPMAKKLLDAKLKQEGLPPVEEPAEEEKTG